MEQEFTAAYKRLNKAQQAAVDAIEGPVLVIAGPGTGKTQLLSLRVANILRQTDADAGNILCLTFTNKAATNMRERLLGLIGPAARQVVVRTFHSFAADIMNDYPDYFWNGARLSVAPEAVQLEIIQSILAGLPLENPLTNTFAGAYTALGDVRQSLKLAKEAGLTPDELRSIIKHNLAYLDTIEPLVVKALSPALSFKKLDSLQTAINALPEQSLETGSLLLPLGTIMQESLALAIAQDEPTGKTKHTGNWKKRWLQTVSGEKGMFEERKRNAWWLAVADVYEEYRESLHQRGYYDYSDMLLEVLEQLEAEPDMRADLQERFQYVLIDEFQDTNAAQLRLAHLVADHFAANNRPNLMAVGDDDQSIFAFNGAELNNMLSFRRSYPDTQLIVLEENYRSAQAVLDTAGQIIAQAEDRLVYREPSITKQLRAQKPPAGQAHLQHLSYPTREHQQLAIAKHIKALWQSGDETIAVLARKHDSLKQLSAILLREGVPIRYDQQSNILEQEAVQQLCLVASTAVAVAHGDRDQANANLARLLRHPMWDIGDKSLWRLAIDNYSAPDWLGSLLAHPDPKLEALGTWLVSLSRSVSSQPLSRALDRIIGLEEESNGFASPFRPYYLDLDSRTNDYLEMLSALEILISLAKEFADRQANLADFVRFIELYNRTDRVIADESWFMSGERAVQLLTVYKAKGLEFDQVFVIDAIDAMWSPRTTGRKSPANLQLQSYGEKYDDYVRMLYVAASRAKRSLTATSYFSDQNGNEILPTPLLSALPLTRVKEPAEAPLEVLEQDLRWPSLQIEDEKQLLAKRLEEFSLSASALIDFLNVAEAGPQSFRDRHLLRLPRPHSAVGSYGTAIHAALETAQRLVNTSRLEVGTVLDRFEAALTAEHLSPIDFERYKTRGLELLQRLLTGQHLKLAAGGIAEQRLDNVQIGGARLKGKLDRVDKHGSDLLISDYKTGKAVSNFTTRDQAKMVKAWRHKTQLLFYILLAQHSSRYAKAAHYQAQMLYVEAEKPNQFVLCLDPEPADLEQLGGLIQVVWEHIQKLDFPETANYPSTIEGIQQFITDLLKTRP